MQCNGVDPNPLRIDEVIGSCVQGMRWALLYARFNWSVIDLI